MIDATAKIHEFVKLAGELANLRIGARSQLDDFVFLNIGRRCFLGANVHLASFVSVVGGGEFAIGDFAGLSAGVRVITGSDDYTGDFLSNPTVPRIYRNVDVSCVEIGRHALVGTNSIIFPGVTIGDGAIVGAGAIVRRDLEPWTVYVGVGVLKAVGKRDQRKVLSLEKEYRNSL